MSLSGCRMRNCLWYVWFLHPQSLPTLIVLQVERYVLHKLYNLDAVAREGYKTFNFPKGMCFVHYLAISNI